MNLHETESISNHSGDINQEINLFTEMSQQKSLNELTKTNLTELCPESTQTNTNQQEIPNTTPKVDVNENDNSDNETINSKTNEILV